MSNEPKSLSDIWLELQLVTMAADWADEDKERLEKAMEELKDHVGSNQETQRKVILRWFTARLGTRLFTNHYSQLLLELANLMATIWTGSPQFKSADEVLDWIQEDASIAQGARAAVDEDDDLRQA